MKCKFCKTVLPLQVCNVCKQLLPVDAFTKRKDGYLEHKCKECSKRLKNEWDNQNPKRKKARYDRLMQRREDATIDDFDEFLAALEATEFKPMSESKWLETCSYFGGCAICGEEHIEARQFFQQFQHGGKYAAWNMFPMCSKCARHIIKVDNPFRWLDKRLGSARLYGLTEERRELLVNYLKAQIEEARK